MAEMPFGALESLYSSARCEAGSPSDLAPRTLLDTKWQVTISQVKTNRQEVLEARRQVVATGRAQSLP